MRIKYWLYNSFLPAWCKNDLLRENERLKTKVLELKQENVKLNAYINGLQDAIRCQRRIVIHNGEVKHE